MSSLVTVLTGAIAAGISWFALHFLGAPLVRFFDLRERVHQSLVCNAKVGPIDDGPLLLMDDTILSAGQQRVAREAEERGERIAKAAGELRELAGELKAFAAARRVCACLVSLLGYEAQTAGDSLMGYANSLHGWTKFRFDCEREVRTALKFPR